MAPHTHMDGEHANVVCVPISSRVAVGGTVIVGKS